MAKESEPTLPSNPLRWARSQARSGKNKDVPCSPKFHQEATCTSRKRYKVRFHGRHHYQHQQDQHLVRAGSNSRRLARTESGTSGAMRNTHDVTASSRQIAVTDSLSCTSTDFDQGHASPATITSDEGHHALAREESWSGILDADPSLGNLPFAGTSETYGEMLSGEPGLGSSAAREISTLSPAEGDLLAIEYMVYPFDSISKSAVDADGTYISPGVLQPSPSAMASPAHNFRMTIDQAPSSPWSVERQGARYMRFYIEKIVRRFTPLWDSTSNPFVSIVIPASMESPILLNSIYAAAASQLALSSPSKEQDHYRSLWYKNQVISMFRRSLSSPDPLTCASLISCVMMQTLEVLDSGVDNWHQWLTGATLLIRNRGRLEYDLADGNAWAFISKAVVAMEILTAVTTPYKCLLVEKYWEYFLRDLSEQEKACNDLLFEHCARDEFFSNLVGCSTVVLFVLSRINGFWNSATRTHNASPVAPDESLHDWEDLLSRESPAEGNSVRFHVSEAFRHAGLIHFCRRVRKLPYLHSVVQRHVCCALGHIKDLNLGDYSVVTNWPMMVAGVELNDQQYPEMAEWLLSTLRGNETGGRDRDGMFHRLEKLLLLIWSTRKSCTTREQKIKIDWFEVSVQKGWRWCFW